MFNLFKSKSSSSSLSTLKVDMHSHLIPGIDDGSQNMETSLELVRQMKELGYVKLITTPHVLGDIYPNTPEKILAGRDELRKRLEKEGVEIELNAAAEYFLDDYVEKILQRKEKLLTLHNNLVLVEFSMAYASHGLKPILFEMQMQGYQPVIAHPERYIYYQKQKEFFDELKDIGCWFQLNLLSLTGHYGKTVTELAHHLIKRSYYDLAGSDLHHAGHIEALKNPSLSTALEKLISTNTIRNQELLS